MVELDKIQALAAILDQYELTRIVAQDDKIVVERAPRGSLAPQAVSQSLEIHTEENRADSAAASDSPVDYNNLTDVRSPIVGVFYSAMSPDSPAYVTINSKVKKGDVLCIIEAMKLMNEITAEQDGTIVDICLKNGDIAEYGQVLFKMTADKRS